MQDQEPSCTKKRLKSDVSSRPGDADEGEAGPNWMSMKQDKESHVHVEYAYC